MEHTFEKIMCGIITLIIVGSMLALALRDQHQLDTWIPCDATVTSVHSSYNSDTGTDEWIIDLEYVREDGSIHTKNHITMTRRMEPGETIPIIYNPNSEKINPDGPPENPWNPISITLFSGLMLLALVLIVPSVIAEIKASRAAKAKKR